MTLVWRRSGVGSGPGNVLSARYKVSRARPSRLWIIFDLGTDNVEDETITVGRLLGTDNDAPATFATMGKAREAAELLAIREGA